MFTTRGKSSYRPAALKSYSNASYLDKSVANYELNNDLITSSLHAKPLTPKHKEDCSASCLNNYGN